MDSNCQMSAVAMENFNPQLRSWTEILVTTYGSYDSLRAGLLLHHLYTTVVSSESKSSQLHVKLSLIYCYVPLSITNPCRHIMAVMSSGLVPFLFPFSPLKWSRIQLSVHFDLSKKGPLNTIKQRWMGTSAAAIRDIMSVTRKIHLFWCVRNVKNWPFWGAYTWKNKNLLYYPAHQSMGWDFQDIFAFYSTACRFDEEQIKLHSVPMDSCLHIRQSWTKTVCRNENVWPHETKLPQGVPHILQTEECHPTMWPWTVTFPHSV